MTRKLATWTLYPTNLPDALLTVLVDPNWNVNDHVCSVQDVHGWCSAFSPHFNPFGESEAARLNQLGATHISPAGCPLKLITLVGDDEGQFEYVDPTNNYGYGVGTIAQFLLDDVPEIHRCMKNGCVSLDAMPCWFPDSDVQSAPDEWYCEKHIHAAGYCKGCGTFWAGIESFDFGGGYCDNCRSEFEHEYYDWDDDEGNDYGWYDGAGYPVNPHYGWADLDAAYYNELPECVSVRILPVPGVLAVPDDIPF